jgi:hypothetical protein
MDSWRRIPTAPTPGISGFWFGLFDPIYAGEEDATRGIYLAGSERFDPQHLEDEWPVGPGYFPEHRYFRSRMLEMFFAEDRRCHAAGFKKLASEFNYIFCLVYTGLWLREMMTTTDPVPLLGEREFRGVGFGFDSGDVITLGVLKSRGFELLARSSS